ncbi:hypothetical protein HLB44_00885 [Aquincola sp. S2]|uniref:DUF4384 domain-containing protein n=1 Tax=Pseudaquabacterium terrae TaxID=2732868 RepID=A0ABX2EA00_9BURK|nr:hypothetical protein [Aquabacterium terrae]NRF65527.1 hypothetical protein [Aquabacterium terrae]
MRAASIGLMVAVGMMATRAWAADPPPLSVAAPGFPTSFVLDQFAARSAFFDAKATGGSSLVASKAVRELQLMITNVRTELRGVADDRWDKLSAERQSLLRALDRQLLALPDPAADRGRIEAPVALDVDKALKALPFDAATPVLRRIDGATQYYRTDGSYRLTITTNLPAAGAQGYAVTLAGQPAPPAWLAVQPPDRLTLTIPAAALANNFADRALTHLPLELTALMPAGSWKFWQSNTAQVRYPISLALFPRKPLSYTLKEAATATAVDATRTLLTQSTPQAIPGCGHAGCERDHSVCREVPAGAKPLETINYTDSVGPGADGSGWTGAVMPAPNGFCAFYKQKSPATERRVGFDIRYNPVAAEPALTERKLKPLQPDKPGDPPADADALEIARAYAAELSPGMLSYTLVLTAFTGQTFAAGSAGAAPSPLLKAGPPERSAERIRLPVRFSLPW